MTSRVYNIRDVANPLRVQSVFGCFFKVLLTLASFAKSPDIAMTMIHTLESIQVSVWCVCVIF